MSGTNGDKSASSNRQWVHNLGLVAVSTVIGALLGNALAFRSATAQIDTVKTALSSEIAGLQRRVDVLQYQQTAQAAEADQDRVEILAAIDKLSDRVFSDQARRYMTGRDSGAGGGN